MKISVCLIVKNEQDVLVRCLDCVKGFADEIIIVDTGSSDNTRQIAKTYTKKLFDFVWCNDFSKARNFAFSKATCDYVMWIDADDIISEENQKLISNLKTSNEIADTYMFRYAMPQDECGYTKFYFYRERLMKNCEMAKFNGFVHEYVIPFGKIVYCNVEILHKRIDKIYNRRNIEIYNSHLEKGLLFSSRDKYYYAKEFFYLGEYNNCLDRLLTLLNDCGMSESDLLDSYITIYKCEENLGHPNIKHLFNAMERFHPTSELLCLIALYYENNKSIKRAITYYKMAVCAPTTDNKIGFKNNYYDMLFPLLKLVFLLYGQKQYEQALKIHHLLLDKFPECEEVKHNQEFFSKLYANN